VIDLQSWRNYLGAPDILQFLKKFDAELNEISVAVRRPYFRFSVSYEAGSFDWSPPHLPVLQSLSQLYELRALAYLAQGDAARAGDDAATIFLLAHAVVKEPFVASQLMSILMVRRGTQVLWEGSAARQWSEQQLKKFQSALLGFDFISSGLYTLLADQAAVTEAIEKDLDDADPLRGISDFKPSSLAKISHKWMSLGQGFRELLLTNHVYGEGIASFDPANHRVNLNSPNGAMKQAWNSHYNLDSDYDFDIAAPIAATASRMDLLYANSQEQLDEALVACGIERYRLANGRLPAKLEDLMPQFLNRVSTDIISGANLHYSLLGDDSYLLYGIGWNGTDDGGKVVR